MLVKQAKSIAEEWVEKESGNISNFFGAFFHGSINWLSESAVFPENSDVDIMVVIENDNPQKIGKFRYKNILLEVSYISREKLQSPSQVLKKYHLAGSFKYPSIILDPSGELTRVQEKVADKFNEKYWVYKRCEHVKNKINNRYQFEEKNSFPEQVFSWVFPAGLTTHLLLTAGLKNPTVRRRFLAVKKLLKKYNYLDFYEELLGLLRVHRLNQEDVKKHLNKLAEVFDLAKEVKNPPVIYASDISDTARTISIGGSREMIKNDNYREAVFWIIVTYARCLKILNYADSNEEKNIADERLRDMLNDLGIKTSSDLKKARKKIKKILPEVWKMAEKIINKNPEIKN